MDILFLLLGVAGWLVSINGWFIVPAILYKGLLIIGAIILVIRIISALTVGRRTKKIFDNFNKF